jgi:hypothetical protein
VEARSNLRLIDEYLKLEELMRIATTEIITWYWDIKQAEVVTNVSLLLLQLKIFTEWYVNLFVMVSRENS